MEEEYEYDSIMGEHKKKKVLSRLNKKNLSEREMDELLGEFEE